MKTSLVKPQELTIIARRFLNQLDRVRVFTLEDVAKHVGQRFLFKDVNDELIFEKENSWQGTFALTIRYEKEDYGPVIGVISNPSLRYSTVLFNADAEVLGYEPGIDKKDAPIKVTCILDLNFGLARLELKKLSDIRSYLRPRG